LHRSRSFQQESTCIVVVLVSALTLNYADEAAGIVQAARTAGIPVVISFTLETDGRLPSGQSLADAIVQVDTATDAGATHFMVNCAHPSHFVDIFDDDGPWDRLRGLRANASRMSHEELDNATERDRGDVADLASGYVEIAERLPRLAVVGGCCGTDLEHLSEISATFSGDRQPDSAASR
jgi:S-methylmethionine-dependent homocysteine/selenocysteine methylase